MSVSHQPAGNSQGRPLDAQPGRVEAAFASARRHSGVVRALKIVLPVAAVLMVVAFVGKSWISAPTGVSVDLGGTSIDSGRLVMADPKLDGFTSDDRPYKMSASRAIQDIGNASRIDLEGIDARLPFADENWMTVAAKTGVFDRDANTLSIDSDLEMNTDTGIRALLRSATVDIGNGSLETKDPVDITLDGSRIEADSLLVRDKGAVMIFKDRVRMQIDAKRLQQASVEGQTNGE